MSNPLYDEIAELADKANDHNHQIGDPERIDIVFTTVEDQERTEKRQKIHQALNTLLNYLEQGNYDIDELTLQVTGFEFKTIGNDDYENIGKFVADFASGEVEEMYVDQFEYKNNVPQKPETRTNLI